jgi:alpha-ketoglutarate-dependent taurine dioxygenase
MIPRAFQVSDLRGAFGCEVIFRGEADELAFWAYLSNYQKELVALIRQYGLVVLRGASVVRSNPSKLIELGRCFGGPVNNLHVGTPARYLHEHHPEIFVNTNLPPSKRVPRSRRREIESLPAIHQYQYPIQQGWHHDQSFIDSPPIVSILYGHSITDLGGNTVYARTAVRSSVPSSVMAKVNKNLIACHAVAGFGRTEPEVENLALVTEEALIATHPLIQKCPFTGDQVFFLSDGTQMDFVVGPFQGLSSGLTGEGASLMRELIHFITAPSNVYVHDWKTDDVVISNNFSNLHAATWYEHTKETRVLWRVTVSK